VPGSGTGWVRKTPEADVQVMPFAARPWAAITPVTSKSVNAASKSAANMVAVAPNG
jgi:hypothetical protein